MEPLLAALQQTQVTAMLAGLLLLFLWESLYPFYEHFRGSFKTRGKHAARNLAMGALNSALIAIVFVGLWFAASVWADEYRFGLMHWLQDGIGIPAWGHALGTILLFDAWSYIWHRMNHEIPIFWRFHRVHHSDPKMGCHHRQPVPYRGNFLLLGFSHSTDCFARYLFVGVGFV